MKTIRLRHLLAAAVCGIIMISGAAPVTAQEQAAAGPASRMGITSDILRGEEHEDITWDLITMIEHNAELKGLLETAIFQAAQMNPDRDTNPVDSLESFYDFMDWSIRAMPWEITPTKKYAGLYDRIDQSMGCFYFILDQPLQELADKGYYHNSLIYHEPFRSWLVKFTSEYGDFLNTEASWCDEYYQEALKNEDFHLQDDLFEEPSNWKTFNDFFARKLRDPSVRPVDEPENDSAVVSPADSVPQGVWQIDDEGCVVMNEGETEDGIPIKTGTLTKVAALLEGSAYADAFAGGMLTHTFLDVNDYHRYHFPLSGTVKEVFVIPADDAPGGVITWDAQAGRYKEYYSEIYGWQSLETRGVIIMETEQGAAVALVPVGMCEVSSVNFEETVAAGAKVHKGDPMGFFLFGGSDIVMIFSKEAGFEMTAEPKQHMDMGRLYGYIK